MYRRYSICWRSLSLLLFFTASSADQVVYLDRPGLPNGPGVIIDEPVFNPKSINASVGEKIRFQTRFNYVWTIPVQSCNDCS